jgi:4-oxalomesaconate tautomerase
MMNLGDVTKAVVPKMCLVSAPVAGGVINTRCFIPHVCHSAIGVLAAVTVATACAIPGTPAASVARLPEGKRKLISVEHPTGEFSIEMETEGTPTAPVLKRAALLRTARLLFDGNVMVPRAVWDGRRQEAQAAE